MATIYHTDFSDVVLPDEGMSEEALQAITDLHVRARLMKAANQRGRFNWRTKGIDPLPANSNGVDEAGGPTDAAGRGGGRGGRQAPPDFGVPGAAPAAAEVRIVWLPMPAVRKRAKEDCAVALAERAPRLYKRGEALAVLSVPEPAPPPSPADEWKGRYEPDIGLQRARIARVEDLENSQVDEAGVQFLGRGRGNPGAKKTAGGGNDANEKFIPIHPPVAPLKAILADPAICPARRIFGVARLPFMDERGRLDMTAGYNPRTGIYHDIADLGAFDVPDWPRDEDVAAACNVLMHPFKHYENFQGGRVREQCWTGEVLTMIFTAIERPFIGNAPMLMVNGNDGGVGKGQLCSSVGYLAYRARGDLITMGESEEEFAKRVDSAIIGGAPLMTFDNLNKHLFTNSALASYSTEGWADIRPYGKKGADIHVEGRSLVMLNGNGLVASEDNVRRTFRVDLSTDNPFPAGRSFPFEPLDEVKRTRPAMLVAAFTIMRWWRSQGMQRSGIGRKPLGSFKEWSIRVGNMVQAVSGWHPVDSIEGNTNADPYRQSASNALNALADRFGMGVWFRSSDVEAICERVANSRRNSVPYRLMPDQINYNLVPTLAATVAAEKKAQAAYDAAKQADTMAAAAASLKISEAAAMARVGWTAARPTATELAALDEALKEAGTKTTSEQVEAEAVQVRIEIDLDEAIRGVTRLGKTSSEAIGNWFRAMEKRPIGGKKVKRDTEFSKRTASISIVPA